MREYWRRFWYQPASPVNLAAARILLSGCGLWMLLSRGDLPQLLEFPGPLWAAVPLERRVRFLILLPVAVERLLFGVAHLTLVAAMLGVWSRAACLASGLLLYHFAPFETALWTGNPYLRGLTIPTLGLLILSFSRCGDALAVWPYRKDAAPSADYTWPLKLTQLLFAQIYFFSGYAKLATSGLEWASAANIRGHLLVLNQLLEFPPGSPGFVLASSPLACAIVGWAGLLFDLAFPLVLFSQTAVLWMLPAAILFHAANSWLFHIHFQNAPLLLLYVDWARLLAPGGSPDE